MSLWSRWINLFRQRKLDAELDEELQSHIEEAIEAGRDPEEARRAFGSHLRHRETTRESHIFPWMDSLASDAAFGLRLLRKNRTATGAAVLSLALTVGACTAAFRVVDAVLLRPLPVASPERLHVLTYEFIDQNGKVDIGDSFEYPLFRQLRDGASGDAELLAISYTARGGLTHHGEPEPERFYRQYVSGRMFGVFGLEPALGRLLTASDDVKPGAHPVAVLSYEYWTRRFARDPKVLGKTFRIGNDVFEIVGVAPKGFTGTETGTLTDIFFPTMMNTRFIDNANWSWFRIWVQLGPHRSREEVRTRLAQMFSQLREQTAKSWKGIPRQRIEQYVKAPLHMEPAETGASGMKKRYRRALQTLGLLVGLLLLIACANVANLMIAQAAARAREMALRVSIGAGRWRLVQLVLVESTLLALAATALGSLFAWWSAPFVVAMINPPDNPVRLVLPADGRVFGFAALLAAGVTFLFGLAPALRASGVKPIIALRGGEDPHARRRLMNTLVGAQVAFCFLVHFLAGLFVATFDRLTHQPTGFSSDHLLAVETSAASERPIAAWEQVAAELRHLPGVGRVAICGWPLMGGNAWTGGVRTPGEEWDPSPPYFLGVSPGWLATMEIPLLSGRDFHPDDAQPTTAIVNEAFAMRYFGGANPVGRFFEQSDRDRAVRVTIVGLAGDALYSNLREPPRPTVYVPLLARNAKGEPAAKDWGTFLVKTIGVPPLALAPAIRRQVSKADAAFRVVSTNTQQELVDSHMIRERVLATLSAFFAALALLLAGIGLYGVLYYSVLQRSKEIGIRMALGANPIHVVKGVTSEALLMLLAGSALGLGCGIASERYVADLLYQVQATDWIMVVQPMLALLIVALLAAFAPVLRAVQTDPARVLRAD